VGGKLGRILGCPWDPLDSMDGCLCEDIKGGSQDVFQAVWDPPKTGRIRLDCLRSLIQL